MNENVEKLMLEHLRAIRSDMARMADRQDTMGAELLIIRQHLSGLLGTDTLHSVEIASLRNRLDRIEKRLELID